MKTAADVFALVGEAMRNADSEALHRLYAEDVDFEDPIAGPLKGTDAVVPYLIAVVEPFTDLQVEFVRVVNEGPHSAVEWRQSGVLETGPMVVLGSAFLTAENGRLTRQRDYFSLKESKRSKKDSP